MALASSGAIDIATVPHVVVAVDMALVCQILKLVTVFKKVKIGKAMFESRERNAAGDITIAKSRGAVGATTENAASRVATESRAGRETASTERLETRTACKLTAGKVYFATLITAVSRTNSYCISFFTLDGILVFGGDSYRNKSVIIDPVAIARFDRHAALPISYHNTDFFGSCATVFQDKIIVVGHINTARRNKAFWLNGTQVCLNYILWERKCVREDASVGGNVNIYKTYVTYSISHTILRLSSTLASSWTQLLSKRI